MRFIFIRGVSVVLGVWLALLVCFFVTVEARTMYLLRAQPLPLICIRYIRVDSCLWYTLVKDAKFPTTKDPQDRDTIKGRGVMYAIPHPPWL